MASNAKDSQQDQQQSNLLPQYGFGPELSFEKLVEQNPFLFRVYTPRPLGPFFDATDAYFLGESFQGEDDQSIPDLNLLPRSRSVKESIFAATYADAVRHLDWTTKSTSPFVSTSFSFAWAVWEACRRYKLNVKHDVHIAVIDARALVGRAVTAIELLRNGSAKERHSDHWKFYRFATESQDVLVYGYIPGSAVLSSIPLVSILDSLPSYFLRPVPDTSLNKDISALSRLTWEYTQKKSTYRHFCKQMSENFLRMNPECRLRDTTAGSIRLAVRLLRTRFHKGVLEDLDPSIEMVYQLALVIASWGGQFWLRDHAEIPGLIRSMVCVVSEEIREARRAKVIAEVARLQSIVDDLEWLARDHDCASTQVGSEYGADVKPDIQVEAEESAAPALDALDQALPFPPEVQHFSALSTVDTSPGAHAVSVKPSAPALSRQDSTDSHSSFAVTASSAVTGFLFGTLAAICILAPPRRELLHLT